MAFNHDGFEARSSENILKHQRIKLKNNGAEGYSLLIRGRQCFQSWMRNPELAKKLLGLTAPQLQGYE
jgi:hypothetical protein